MTESVIFPWKSKETKEEGELGVVINFLATKVKPSTKWADCQYVPRQPCVLDM